MDCPINRSLYDLTSRAGIPLLTLSKATDCKSAEVLFWWNKIGVQKYFKERHLINFSRYFGVSEQQVLARSVDISLIRKRFLGPLYSLPDHYENFAFSSLRSSYYIVEYLSLLFGKQFTDNLLNELNVHPLIFEDLNRKISIRFVNDLLGCCRKLGFSNQEFNFLAGAMYLSVEKSGLLDLVKGTESSEEFFYAFQNLCNHFDSNFTYDFQIGLSGLTVENRPGEHIFRLIEKGEIDIQFLENYRSHLFSASQKLVGKANLDVSIDKSISRGNRFTRFNIRY